MHLLLNPTGKEKRSMNTRIKKLIPLLIIILGFFTLGLSDLIWIYSISDRFDRRRFLPMKQVALTVITFGIYGIYWTYKLSSEMHKSLILKNKQHVAACLILSICFLRTISVFILHRALDDAKTTLSKDTNQ
jgi:hypothetical protein